MLSAASMLPPSALGFAGPVAAPKPNPLLSAATRIAEIGIVGMDERAAKQSVRHAFSAPLRAARDAADRVGAAITMAAEAPQPEAPPPPPPYNPETFAKSLPGITGPLGFFDPVGFCSAGGDNPASEGKIRFYREVEVKHARVAMLAALGFPVAEQFHPLFGGNIDAPSYVAFQQTPLQTFWPAVVIAIAVIEIFSVIPAFKDPTEETWAIKSSHLAGDYGWDPLGLKPTSEAELKEMQTKELNNGRLAMIAAAGMIAQELASGKKLF